MAKEPTAPQTSIDTNDSCIVQHSFQLHTFSVSKDTLEAIRYSMSSGSDELAFGFFLLSMGLTSLFSLLTTEVNNRTVHVIFCVALVVGATLGSFMIWKWWQLRRGATKLIDDILKSPIESRKRLK